VGNKFKFKSGKPQYMHKHSTHVTYEYIEDAAIWASTFGVLTFI